MALCHLASHAPIKVFGSFVISCILQPLPWQKLVKHSKCLPSHPVHLTSQGSSGREHAKRVTYQAKYVWRQFLVVEQALPSPGLWGRVELECGWESFVGFLLPKQQKHSKSWLGVGAQKAVQENATAISADPDDNVEEHVMGSHRKPYNLLWLLKCIYHNCMKARGQVLLQ